MGKRRSNNSVTATQDRTTATAVTNSRSAPSSVPPASERASSNALPFILAGVGLLGVMGLIAVVWSQAPGDDDHPDPTKPKFQKWEVVTADDRVCDSFMQKRDAGDPGADDLLAAAPGIPGGAVTESEAEAIQTDCFLRDSNLQVVEIRKTQVPNRYCFVTKGNVAAPRLEVRRNNDTSSEQRTMTNPDLFLEVRDGKICGVRATLHRD
jgi:hypothetical protein